MTDETSPPPAENLILHILREMRAEMNGRFDRVEERLGRLESGMDEVGLAVATLTLSNRHIRADVHKILANQDNHEQRLKVVETQ